MAKAAHAPVAPPPETGPCRTFYVFWPRPDGNHTSFLIRREDFPVPQAVAALPQVKDGSGLAAQSRLPTDWVEVGYGNLEYYEDVEKGELMSRWKIVERTPGAMMVRPFPWGRSPGDWVTTDGLDVFAVELPTASYRALLRYVAASFTLGQDGAPSLALRLDTGPSAAFIYRSPLPFSFRRFCNVWALEGLRDAGLPTRPWTITQGGVKKWFRDVYRTPAACRPPAPMGGPVNTQ
ncbi:MAG: DUF2459 domain-containing protein [Elusimicrobiota bacterium]